MNVTLVNRIVQYMFICQHCYIWDHPRFSVVHPNEAVQIASAQPLALPLSTLHFKFLLLLLYKQGCVNFSRELALWVLGEQ